MILKSPKGYSLHVTSDDLISTVSVRLEDSGEVTRVIQYVGEVASIAPHPRLPFSLVVQTLQGNGDLINSSFVYDRKALRDHRTKLESRRANSPKQRATWQHNSLFGSVGMIRSNLDRIIATPTATDEAKAIADELRSRLASLTEALKTRKPL